MRPFFRNINKILYWYRAPLLLWEYDQQILQSLALFVLESIFNICGHLHPTSPDRMAWLVYTHLHVWLQTIPVEVFLHWQHSMRLDVSVWAPDQLGGGWGREDGGRGFGLGGHSTVDSMPQGPRLNPALSSISCQGCDFFRLTFGVRERRERFWEHDFFLFQPCFQAKTTGSGRWTCSSWPL